VKGKKTSSFHPSPRFVQGDLMFFARARVKVKNARVKVKKRQKSGAQESEVPGSRPR
jgi:hypothetical protein